MWFHQIPIFCFSSQCVFLFKDNNMRYALKVLIPTPGRAWTIMWPKDWA